MNEIYRKRGHIVVGIALFQLIAALALMTVGILNEWLSSMQSNLIMGGALFIYWILSDVVEPKAAHRFDDITEAQKAAYPKYIFWDFVGYAGIAYFLLGMGSAQSNSLVGAIAYVISMKPKRENQDLFLGRVVPEEEQIEEEQIKAEEQTEAEEKEMDAIEVMETEKADVEE